jgi:hypothetical protein
MIDVAGGAGAGAGSPWPAGSRGKFLVESRAFTGQTSTLRNRTHPFVSLLGSGSGGNPTATPTPAHPPTPHRRPGEAPVSPPGCAPVVNALAVLRLRRPLARGGGPRWRSRRPLRLREETAVALDSARRGGGSVWLRGWGWLRSRIVLACWRRSWLVLNLVIQSLCGAFPHHINTQPGLGRGYGSNPRKLTWYQSCLLHPRESSHRASKSPPVILVAGEGLKETKHSPQKPCSDRSPLSRSLRQNPAPIALAIVSLKTPTTKP